MSLAIFLSYGLQFYVPINIIGPWFRDHFTGDLARQVSDAGLRIGLIVFTCEFIATQCVANTFPAWIKYNFKFFPNFLVLLAAIVPNLGAVISLVGSVSSSTLALIFPPLIEIITFYPDKLGRYNWVLWKDILIMVLGIVGFVFGSYASMFALMYPTPD